MDSYDAPLLSVSQITLLIKTQLEASLSQLWIQGEASNIKLQHSGHLYFDLKDAEAKISIVVFRGYRQHLPTPKEGEVVKVYGSISVYPPQGKYQFVAQHLESIRTGDLWLQFAALKQELLALGWFDPSRKKALPPFPTKIGVVTSPTGAVIQDIIHVLTRRYFGFELLLYPVKVQGEGAAQEIATAIRHISPLCDVILLARGGGSIEDLWPFNERIVAEAIVHSPTPIISAIGHETDFTIADGVADYRAPTPSAAAEILSQDKTKLHHAINSMHKEIQHAVQSTVNWYKEQLHKKKQDPMLSITHFLDYWIQKMDHLQERWQDALLAQKLSFTHRKQRCMQYQQQIHYALENHFNKKKELLSTLQSTLATLHPYKTLSRGYAILRKGTTILHSIHDTTPGEALVAQLHDGTLNLSVEEAHENL